MEPSSHLCPKALASAKLATDPQGRTLPPNFVPDMQEADIQYTECSKGDTLRQWPIWGGSSCIRICLGGVQSYQVLPTGAAWPDDFPRCFLLLVCLPRLASQEVSCWLCELLTAFCETAGLPSWPLHIESEAGLESSSQLAAILLFPLYKVQVSSVTVCYPVWLPLYLEHVKHGSDGCMCTARVKCIRTVRIWYQMSTIST